MENSRTARNTLDFDTGSLRQGTRSDTGPSWFPLGEMATVDFIHSRKVSHIGEEDGGLHDPIHPAPSRLHNLPKIDQHLFGLRRDVRPADHFHAGWVEGNLAGAKQHVATTNGLTVRTDRRRRGIAVNRKRRV